MDLTTIKFLGKIKIFFNLISLNRSVEIKSHNNYSFVSFQHLAVIQISI
ncbi:unnamed protein product [Paramecium primaurelia]|uniref:Uncharacterized protein n=1 Tax=Paramecium primaurelia TaxID=5886 RepID=A0A8S1QSY3_PARPR|nr:unnamed protein product [Paramecium primaurelia]